MARPKKTVAVQQPASPAPAVTESPITIIQRAYASGDWSLIAVAFFMLTGRGIAEDQSVLPQINIGVPQQTDKGSLRKKILSENAKFSNKKGKVPPVPGEVKARKPVFVVEDPIDPEMQKEFASIAQEKSYRNKSMSQMINCSNCSRRFDLYKVYPMGLADDSAREAVFCNICQVKARPQ